MSNIDYLEKLDKLQKLSTGGIWRVIETDGLNTAWVTTDSESSNAVALLDYNIAEQNKCDAHFIVAAHNHISELILELKELRSRTLDLLEKNSMEVEKRISLQNEVNRLKEK